MMQVEPFTGFPRHPTLQAWKHRARSGEHDRTTMDVEWNTCGLMNDREFITVLDDAAMNAELLAIWEAAKPRCRHGAEFNYGGAIGCMLQVPIDAGTEAVAVVRKYFTEALEKVAEKAQ